MKKMRSINKTGLLLIGMIVTSLCLKAQVPTYQCVLKNDSLLTNQVYEFDVYLKNTSPVTFELANFQVGILVNPMIVNGGALSVVILPGSSQFTLAQQPSEAMFSIEENCLKLAPKSPPGYSGGTLISDTGSGTKICRLQLANTLPFGMDKPDLSFNFAVFPYNTVVSAYDRTSHLNVNISSSGNHFTTGLNNPFFNVPVPVDSVSGSGSFCQGTPGLPVTLSNSQADMKYQLKNGGINDGGEVAGSGASLTWINRTTGNYTVSGRRTATYQVAGMAGAAIVTMDHATVGGVVNGGTTITLGSPTDTLQLQRQLGAIVMWQKQINNGGYSDIPSTAGLAVYRETPSLAGTWDYRTIVQNGICSQEGSTPATVVVSATPLLRSWIGVIDEKWNDAGNWSPGGVPGDLDDILIPASAPFMPVVKVQGLSCNNIIIQAGALLTINPGFVLTVNGNIAMEQ